MRLHDINVLVYAHRPESDQHQVYRDFLTQEMQGEQTYAVCDYVINGFLRIVTDRRIYRTPTPPAQAIAAAERLRHGPNAVVISPGPRHWSIFTRLVQETGAAGRDLPDAFLAALAVEHSCEFVTNDKGFKRFRGLRLAEV